MKNVSSRCEDNKSLEVLQVGLQAVRGVHFVQAGVVAALPGYSTALDLLWSTSLRRVKRREVGVAPGFFGIGGPEVLPSLP